MALTPEELEEIAKADAELERSSAQYHAEWLQKNKARWAAYMREYRRKKKATTGAATPTAAKED